MKQLFASSHIPKIDQYGAFLTIEGVVFDPKTGREVEKIPPRPANTFVQNWIKWLYIVFSQSGGLAGVIDVTNASRTPASTNTPFRIEAAAGATNYGIVIGNQVGPAAVTLSDYKLQSQVVTNITHGVMSFSLNAPDGTHYQVIAQRTFTNNTGSTLSITEAGIYSYYAGTGNIWCLDHTLISISVGNTLATTLYYTWTTHT